MYADGASLSGIADKLKTSKVPGPFDVYPNRGGITYWTPSTVRAILLNPAYIGRVVWDRRKNVGKKVNPNNPDKYIVIREIRSRDEWSVKEQKCPALVDRATWDAVQQRMIRHGPRTPGDSPYLLTGLIRCATCDNLVTGGGGSRKGAADPTKYRFYRCRGALRGNPPVCAKPI